MLIAINFGSGVAGYMTVPLVAKYVMTFGADITTASAVSGILSLVAMFMCPVAGVLSDRINKKKLLIITEAAYAVCLGLHAFARSLIALLLLRAVTGIFFSLSNVLTIAYASSYIPKSRMGEGLGYFGLVVPLVQAAGPSVGLGLRDSIGYGAVFTGAAIAALAAMICVAVLPYNAPEPSGQKKTLKFNDIFAVRFIWLMLLTALFSSANGLISTYLDILASERSITNISIFFTVFSVVLIIFKPLTGKLLDSRGMYLVIIPAVVFAALGMFFVGIASSLWVMLIAAVCKALGQGAGTPTIQIGQSLGNSIAPVLGSFLVKPFGYTTMFCGFGGIILVAGFLFLILQARREKKVPNSKIVTTD